MDTVTEKIPVPKAESWKIFDAISHRYDLLNSILSLGFHIRWRDALNRHVPSRETLKVLDLATGTADVLIALARKNTNIAHGVGIDLSENMLKVGRQKISRLGLDKRLSLQKGDATKQNFLDHEFDLVTMSFGIRNVENPILALKEIYRVLKPAGKAVILEFSLPKNPVIKLFYLVYLKVFVPLIGGLLTGNFRAYYYLNRTIEQFPYGKMFCRMMSQCGFSQVTAQPLLFGIATIYAGEKKP